MKDTWTKPKGGRIKGGTWFRENGDKRTSTTINECGKKRKRNKQKFRMYRKQIGGYQRQGVRGWSMDKTVKVVKRHKLPVIK